MKILIVEDEPLHADRFEMLAEQMGYEVAGVCDNAFDALDCFHRTAPDLLLFDIHLAGEVDGVGLAGRINETRPVPVVFVTSMTDDKTFARARALRPVAFILKPFDMLQLQRAIELAVSQLAENPVPLPEPFTQYDLVLPDCLFVKVRSKLEKVPLGEILYIEADGRYSMVHTAAGRKYAIRISLTEMQAKLPGKQFAQSHRSYLVNLAWLQQIDLQEMTVLVGDKTVPLSKSYREDLLARLDQV
ncbi:MAG: DNA-binding response regulator [Bacteroidetes bacterium]|nr:MAG: DNA-binding response regulator [Bacteroidota bacterium]